MNKNSLWSKPNVARKVNNSATLHSGYMVDAVPEFRATTWPINLADGIDVQTVIYEIRLGYANAVSGNECRVGMSRTGRHA